MVELQGANLLADKATPLIGGKTLQLQRFVFVTFENNGTRFREGQLSPLRNGNNQPPL
jgi:hypothetical protein